MARTDWMHTRLLNWARWHATMTSGGMGFATQSAFLSDASMRDQPMEARIPIDEIEASVTNDAVEALKVGHGHLHETLRLYYLKGAGIKATARAMQRAESTIHAQLGQADVLLAAWFKERKRRQDAAAAELNAKLHAARPAFLNTALPAPAKPVRLRATLKLRGRNKGSSAL